MKVGMSSLDVLAIVRELQLLKDARINKVFQTSPTELKVQLGVKGVGKMELVIEAGRRIHLTEYPKPSPKKPSTFAMTLRKYIANGVIKGVEQLGFDRIVELRIQKTGEFYLIAELFGKGNIILTDGDRGILAVMKPGRYKDRELVIRGKYELPPQKINPYDISPGDLKSIVSASKSDLVRTIVTQLGLGGVYAEEACLLSGVEKGKTEIGEEEASKILEALQYLKNTVGKEGIIVFKDDAPLDVVPLTLRVYEGMRGERFGSFNKALDEYFTKYEIKKVEAIREEKYLGEIGRLEARLQEQYQTLEKYQKMEEEGRATGDLIYQHFKMLEDILSTVSEARQTYSWEEIRRRIREGKGRVPAADVVEEILPREGLLLIRLDGREIKLDVRKSVTENAEYYYSRSKRAKKKILGVKKAIEQTKEEIRGIEERGREAIEIREKKPRKRVVKKKEWYEKFRWFVSSDGFLVLGGRDATTNEILVKKHMGKGDLFVHADIHGAPAVVIKAEGREVPERSIKEAFDFAATYSRAWKHGIFALDVYWVTPEQVSKTTEHGEYVAKGAFIIRGKKNYGSGRVEVAIGVKINEEARVVGGPPDAVEKQSDYPVRIIPGRIKSKEIAEEIKKRWLDKAKEEHRGKISAINIGDIQEFLPAGGSELSKKG